jgi:hypothetical protein
VSYIISRTIGHPIRFLSQSPNLGLDWACNLLSVKKTDGKAKWRKQYYTLAKQCHPDSAKVDEADPKRFGDLSEAYKILLEYEDPSIKVDIPDEDDFEDDEYGQAKTKWAVIFYGLGYEEQDMEMDPEVVNGLIDACDLAQVRERAGFQMCIY